MEKWRSQRGKKCIENRRQPCTKHTFRTSRRIDGKRARGMGLGMLPPKMFRKEVHAPFDTAQYKLHMRIAYNDVWHGNDVDDDDQSHVYSMCTYFKIFVDAIVFAIISRISLRKDRERARMGKRNNVDDMTDLLLLLWIWKCINTRHACSENNNCNSFPCDLMLFLLNGINETANERYIEIQKNYILILYRIFIPFSFLEQKQTKRIKNWNGKFIKKFIISRAVVNWCMWRCEHCWCHMDFCVNYY